MQKQALQIDGNNFSTLEGFFQEVSERLIPSAWWGHNLDAFNDILRGGFGTPEKGFLLCWKNHQRSRATLGHEETVRQLQKRLERCHPLNIPAVEALLFEAQRGEGPTVFDWLIEIIRTHGPGGSEAEDNVELLLQ
jgi:RNAse (barnase) inhibitor barstar